jgi:hypothetical protein
MVSPSRTDSISAQVWILYYRFCDLAFVILPDQVSHRHTVM